MADLDAAADLKFTFAVRREIIQDHVTNIEDMIGLLGVTAEIDTL